MSLASNEAFISTVLSKLDGDSSQSNFMQCEGFDLQGQGDIVQALILENELENAVVRADKALLKLLGKYKYMEREYGVVDALWIGFPLVEVDQFRCPLILWKVDMSNPRANVVVLNRDFEDPVMLNNALCHYLLQEYGIDLKGVHKRYDKKQMFNDCDIERLVHLILKAPMETIQEKLQECLDKLPKIPGSRKKPRNEPAVIWGGVLGLFQTGSATIGKDLTMSKNAGLPQQRLAIELLYSAFPLDPSQFRALEALRDSTSNIVIHGPPGTGKSQTLSSMIACVGANNMKTLVVCEKRTPLAIIQNKLDELCWNNQWKGGKFSILITNVQDERELIITTAHQNRADVFALTDERRKQEQFLVQEIARLESEMTEETGKFIKHKQVNERRVSFNLTLKDALIFIIQKKLDHQRILTNVPLDKIFAEDHIMRLDHCEQSMDKVIKEALFFINLSKFGKLGFNAEKLVQHASDVRDHLKTLLKERDEVMQQCKHAELTKLQVNLDFLNIQLEELDTLQEQMSGIPSSEIQRFDSPSWLDKTMLFFKLGGKLRYFDSALRNIQAKLENQYREETNVVLPTNFTLSNMKSLVRWCKQQRDQANQNLEKFLKYDLKKLYQKCCKAELDAKNEAILNWFSMETMFNTKAAVDRLKNCLEQQIDGNEAFWSFDKELLSFRRETISIWYEVEDSINCLIDFKIVEDERLFHELLRTGNWGEKIKLAILIHQVSDDCRDLITSDFVLEKLRDTLGEIRNHMRSLYCLRQGLNMRQAIENHEQKSQQRFEQLFMKKRSNQHHIRALSLREIIQKDMDLFTNCFPVILCTPEVASTLFQGKTGYFDLVVFDEASQSLVQNGYCSLLKGKKIVIAGDAKQMPPTTLFTTSTMNYDDEDDNDIQRLNAKNAANAESLLDFATDHSFTFQSFDLQFHYRSMDPDLMKFHNLTLYPKMSLCCPLVREDDNDSNEQARRAIQMTHLEDGVYENQGNQREADVIVDILKTKLLQSPDHSIAIATFNEVQKKLILKTIQNRHGDQAFQDRLRFLQSRNGFFVKNLEHLQGDEVDILIVGTTFGPNRHGNFDRRFGRITFSGVGYRYLNVLFSRAKNQVHIVTSIPESEFSNPERTIDDCGVISGVSFLFGYLSYAKAVSGKDMNRIESILRTFAFEPQPLRGLKEQKPDDPNTFEDLEGVIYEHLRKLTVSKNITKVERGIIVKLDNHKVILIECNNYDNYREAIHRKSMLEKFGYVYITIWPVNWLQNPKLQFEKLRYTISQLARKSKTTPPPLPTPPEQSSPNANGDEEEAPMEFDNQNQEQDVEEDYLSGRPYLVRYGMKRKFIVFQPERAARGDPDSVSGRWGKKKKPVTFPKTRLIPLDPKKVSNKDAFLDSVEFEKAAHYL